MSDSHLDNLLPDFGEYSLEPVLESFRRRAAQQDAPDGQDEPAREPDSPARAAENAEVIAQRSRQIVMEALGETLSRHRKIPELKLDSDELDETLARAVGAAAPKREPARSPAAAEEPEPPEGTRQPEPEPELERKKSRIHVSPDGIITMDIELPQEEPEDEWPEEEPAFEEEEPGDEDDFAQDEPAAGGKKRLFPLKKLRSRAARAEQEPPSGDGKPSARERFLAPVVRLIATRLARRQMQTAEAANWPDPVEFRETDEMPPKKASKFYGQQLRPLRFRCRVCLFLCMVLAWICFGLPMAGLLGKSLRVQAGVSLVLLLTVMMAALDILATGVRQLFDLRPGAESLSALAALMSAIDAAMVMLGYGTYLPFCAIGAFSLASALWGERLDCLARARSMRAASLSSSPAAVTAEETPRGGKYISRSPQPVKDIVRRCEQADFCRSVYSTASAILMAADLVLAILASLNGRGAYFLHTLSALLCVSASFTAFLSFPLPYSIAAGRLQNAGAAIIGYEGAASIGKSRRVVITDEDLFPPGTMALTAINVLEGAPVDKVIAATASLLSASGSGVTSVFMELMERRKYQLCKLEEFRCHEGGGLSARVEGEQVLVGSAGFMNLMGIRIPRGMFLQNAVCTAMSGELVGVFNISYTPKNYVKYSLASLLQGRTQPVFALRDFNITPLMIRHLFGLPTESFNFPTFRDRYRIAAAAADGDWPIAAVLSRTGMGPLVDASEAGSRLYSACRIGTVLSLLGSVVGIFTMFLLCQSGSFDTATAGNALSYMLLWTLPVLFLAVGQSR